MAISFLTDDPEALLSDFKNKIDNGKIVSWSYDKDGDFTHTPDPSGRAGSILETSMP